MNQINIIGIVGKDPTISKTKNGDSSAFISVYARRSTNIDKGDWFNCFVFGKVVDNYISKYVKKGTKVAIIGEMQFGEKERYDGTTQQTYNVYVREIQLISSKKDDTSTNSNKDKTVKLPTSKLDEELPFD